MAFSYAQYGNFQFQPGEVDVAIDMSPVTNSNGVAYAFVHRWTYNILITDRFGSVMGRTAAIIAAFSVNGKDCKIAGTTHQLLSASTLGGTRVVKQPAFPNTKNTETVTIRTITAIVEGFCVSSVDFGGTVGGMSTQEFHEEVSFSGGGPEYGHILTLNTLPVKQKLRSNTLFIATQSGHAVGFGSRPDPPDPLWPNSMVRAPTFKLTSPKFMVESLYDYAIDWSYYFEDGNEISGVTTIG